VGPPTLNSGFTVHASRHCKLITWISLLVTECMQGHGIKCSGIPISSGIYFLPVYFPVRTSLTEFTREKMETHVRLIFDVLRFVKTSIVVSVADSFEFQRFVLLARLPRFQRCVTLLCCNEDQTIRKS
jgi:hypothetical protein